MLKSHRIRRFTAAQVLERLRATPVAVAPEYGARGKAAGPRALTRARNRVEYEPKLEGPWQAMADLATEDLAEALAAEYAHAVERMETGHSY